MADFSMLVDVSFSLEFIESATSDLFCADQLGELLKGRKLRTEVEVVKESVLLVPDVNKGGIETLNNFLYAAQVNVTY